MTEEEYKQLMSDCGFSVVEDDLASRGLYYVAFYGDSSKWQNAFAVYDTDNGEVTLCTKLYYEKLQGICVNKDKKIETKYINTLRPIVISIAEQYKNCLLFKRKKKLKKILRMNEIF